MVTVSIVGILSAVAVPSFTETLESSKSSNAKQFVVDAAKDCSIAILYEHDIPVVTQTEAGPDITVFAASFETIFEETVPPLPFITRSSFL